MADLGWLNGIAGLRVLKSFLGTVATQRSILKVGGLPISDNGSETVLNAVQTLAAAGAWDGKSGIVLVGGTGVRIVTVGDPLDLSPGTIVRFVNTGNNTLTLDPSGTIANSASNVTGIAIDDSYAICWIAAGRWAKA